VTESLAGDQSYPGACSANGLGVAKADPFVIGAVDGHDVASDTIDQIDGREIFDRPMPDSREPPLEPKLGLLTQAQFRAEGARDIEKAVGAGKQGKLGDDRNREGKRSATFCDPKGNETAKTMSNHSCDW